MTEFWISFSTGLLSGIIATVVFTVTVQQIKRYRFKNIYDEYEGFYLAYDKRTEEWSHQDKSIFENPPSYAFTISRSGNKFAFKGLSTLGYPDLSGEILMTTSLEPRGSGFYRHKKDPKGIVRFGFIEVQLSGSEILAHMEVSDGNITRLSAYRWVKYRAPAYAEEAIRKIQTEEFKKRWPDADPSKYHL